MIGDPDIMDAVIEQLSANPTLAVGTVAVAAALYYIYTNNYEKTKCLIDVNNQTQILPGKERIRTSTLLNKEGTVMSYEDPAVLTLHDSFLHGLKSSNNGDCLGYRPSKDADYKWLSYQQVLDQSQQIASGLIKLGAKAENDQFVGVFAQNRVEWKVVEQACNGYSMVLVPLYDTLGPESIKHIMNQCDLKMVIVDKSVKAMTLLQGVKNQDYGCDLIVIMDTITDDVVSLANETSVNVKSFDDVLALGKENPHDFVPPKADDLHTILYTSGTTGLPKGAMLTHKNFISNISGVKALGKTDFLQINEKDTYISYLPLAHGLERVCAAMMYYSGARVGFFQGDIRLLMGDVAALKPTVFPMVPRLVNKMYDKIQAGVAGSKVLKFLMDMALNHKMKLLKKGILTRDTIWDRLVFKKVQNLMGGNVRLAITGAAPIAIDVLNFMRCALGIFFAEGYGQTEATAAISLSIPGDYFSGSVGTPACCCQVKLVDVEDQNYAASSDKGEVCVKGANVFKGYYKDEKKTKEAFDEEGWLHTGDIGMWLPNGSLKIIDRKKHIFKLSQGEYIAPEKIEQCIVQSIAVAQVFIYGYSLKSSLVCVAVPDPETFTKWCASNGVNGTYDELCNNDKVNKLVLDDMCKVGKSRGLKSFELPRKVFLSNELFSVENGLLTPTFKSKRPQLFQRYKDTIDSLYVGMD